MKKHLLVFLFFCGQIIWAQNSSLQFNGNNGYVTIQRQIADDFTIEFWIKTTQTGGSSPWWSGQGLVDAEKAGGAFDFGLALVEDKVVFWNGQNDSAPDMELPSSTAVNDGEWHHVAATRVKSTGEMKLYIDGNLEGTAYAIYSIGESLDRQSTIFIGAIHGGDDVSVYNFFAGQIDELRICDVARSEEDIQATKNERLTGGEGGLVNYYNFDEGSGTTIGDFTSNANHGELFGDVDWASDALVVPTIEISPRNVTVSRSADAITITITSDIGWNVLENSSWITPNITSGSGNGTVQISYTENTSGNARKDTVRFATESDTVKLIVTQLSLEGDGTENNPYTIYSYEDLKSILALSLSASYRLANNVDASASASENSGAGFSVIGSHAYPFTGTFHGGGHTIRNLTINREGSSKIGFFGVTGGATIDSLGLKNVNVSGNEDVGGLVGEVNQGSISHCYTTGMVNGNDYVGGLVGDNNGGTITHCYSTASVNGYEVVGGFVGENDEGVISYSYATGFVSGSGGGAGGLVGSNNGGQINHSYSTGMIVGDYGVGGFVGGSYGVISDCYSTGMVVGNNTVGGFVGIVEGSGDQDILRSYSTGSVNGSVHYGGFVGDFENAQFYECYWNTHTSHIGYASGGDEANPSGITGQTTAEWKKPQDAGHIALWDFTNTWNILANITYPVLRGINNAPFAAADTLYSGATFALSNLLWNDYDFETNQAHLTYAIYYMSDGTMNSGVLEFPENPSDQFTIDIDYRVGEVVGSDTLWGNMAHSYVVYEAPLPVETVSFTASAKQNGIELQWKTATEVNNFGFEIEKSRIQKTEDRSQNKTEQWIKIGFVEGNGTTNAPKEYSFIDKNLSAGRYAYRLKQIDRDGKFGYSQEVEVTIGSVPKVFALEQNYPNPFNPSTTIGFMLQTSGMTTLKIYDAIGREVAVLANENLEAGVYYQKTFDAGNLSSGLYFAQLQSGNKMQVKKLVLMK